MDGEEGVFSIDRTRRYVAAAAAVLVCLGVLNGLTFTPRQILTQFYREEVKNAPRKTCTCNWLKLAEVLN